MTTYRTFEIKINNVKNGTVEYRDYAITTNEQKAWEAVNEYARNCMKRYKVGSTYTVTALNY